jgi:hypothetical protein
MGLLAGRFGSSQWLDLKVKFLSLGRDGRATIDSAEAKPKEGKHGRE